MIKKGTSITKHSKQISLLSHTAFFFEDPSISCEILHEQTGTPIAQVSPLIIACFEGDVDIIRFFIEVSRKENSLLEISTLNSICQEWC